MNEQIKLLAKQAYEDVIKNTPSFLVTKELYEQKFADMIVRECGRALNPMLRDMISRGQAVDMIKQHFGVEE